MRKTVAFLFLALAAPAIAKPPKLTVFIAVDALSSDLLMRMLPRLTKGFRLLTTDGAYFPDARFDYASLVTGAGHATLATGANPRRHGIVGNFVVNRQTGEKKERVFADARYRALEAEAESDVAPTNLLAETLSDRLRFSTYGRAKSVALSTKARAAIPLGGRLGKAFWFNESSGHFLTSSYYAADLPGWVKSFNNRAIPHSYMGKLWTLSRPSPTYLGDDDRPFESDQYGLGRKFPHPLSSNAALVHSPFMNDLLVEFALSAIHSEELGKDDIPDLLSVSFSATDHIGHLFGPCSWEAQDAMIRLDQAIQNLITGAERAAGGRANLLVVLSADHGGGAAPEAWRSAGMPGVRLTYDRLEQRLAKGLEERFKANVVFSLLDNRVYLDHQAIASRKLDLPTVRRAAAQWLEGQPEVAMALAVDDLGTASDLSGYLEAISKGFHPDHGGDVLFLLRPFNVMMDETESASHGMPYGYDSQVPIIFWGAGVKPGFHPEEIRVVDLAPTTATLLGMSIPALAEGAPLPQVISAASRSK